MKEASSSLSNRSTPKSKDSRRSINKQSKVNLSNNQKTTKRQMNSIKVVLNQLTQHQYYEIKYKFVRNILLCWNLNVSAFMISFCSNKINLWIIFSNSKCLNSRKNTDKLLSFWRRRIVRNISKWRKM